MVIVVVLDARFVHGGAKVGIGRPPAVKACATVNRVAEGVGASTVVGVGVVVARVVADIVGTLVLAVAQVVVLLSVAVWCAVVVLDPVVPDAVLQGRRVRVVVSVMRVRIVVVVARGRVVVDVVVCGAIVVLVSVLPNAVL